MPLAWAHTAVEQAIFRGATWADCRAMVDEQQHLATRNGQVSTLRQETAEGLGIRVLVDGAWGFASTATVQEDAVRQMVDRAVALARASAVLQRSPVVLAPQPPERGRWETPVEIDPFTVPLAEKIALLQDAEALLHVQPAIRLATAQTSCRRQHVRLVTSDGADVEQVFTWTGGGLRAVAVSDAGEAQMRSWPNSFGGQHEAGGWEVMRRISLAARASQVAHEAVMLLSADPCPRGRTTLILDSSQLALQIHESIGHALEADRLFGFEASFAGGTHLRAEDTGTLRFGSPEVTVMADATRPGGLGTFGWDDEGVPAQRWPLIEAGILRDWLTCRQTAALMGAPASRGASRSSGFHRVPLVRMVNIDLQPGRAGTLEDLIADTEWGIYMETNRSWSIDERRQSFHFGVEWAFEIQNGRRTRLLKNASYAGTSLPFWQRCDAVCGASDFRSWGFTNCGKGQPGQLMAMSHGAAPARFRAVDVGLGGGEP
jgi:TldD protein